MKKIIIIIFIFIIINLCFICFITKCTSFKFDLNNARSLAYSVGIYENEAMVCSFWWDGGHGGIVEFFENKDNKWQLTYSLDMDEIDKSFKYGRRCAIYKDYAAICADPMKGKPGAVVVLKKEGEKWVKHQILQPKDKEADDLFGFSIDMYEDYLLIGAENKSHLRGAAYLFKLENDKFNEIQKFEQDDFTGLSEFFGTTVSIYKDYMAISAPDNKRYCEPNLLKQLVKNRKEGKGWSTTQEENEIIYRYNGAVYVYKHKNDKWVEIAKLHSILYEQNINFDEFGSGVLDINEKFIIAISGAREPLRSILYIFKIENEKIAFDSVIDVKINGNIYRISDAILCYDYLITTVSPMKERQYATEEIPERMIFIYKNINGKWVKLHQIKKNDLTLKDENEKDYSFGGHLEVSNGRLIIGSSEFDEYNVKTVLPIMGNVNIVEFDDKGFKELFFYPPKEQKKENK